MDDVWSDGVERLYVRDDDIRCDNGDVVWIPQVESSLVLENFVEGLVILLYGPLFINYQLPLS